MAKQNTNVLPFSSVVQKPDAGIPELNVLVGLLSFLGLLGVSLRSSLFQTLEQWFPTMFWPRST